MLVNINFDYSILTRIIQKRAHHGSLLVCLVTTRGGTKRDLKPSALLVRPVDPLDYHYS
jgi:hypothetical protein